MEIYITSYFKKEFKRLPKQVRQKTEEKENIFRDNPFSSILNTHKLHGKYKNYWFFSIDNSYRIMFKFLNSNTKAVFIDIGNHKIYK